MFSDYLLSACKARLFHPLLVMLAAMVALLAPSSAHAQTATLTTIYDFDVNGGANGINPNPLIVGKDGNFYGSTITGTGGSSRGEVFKLTPDGTLTILHRFHGGMDGSYPETALVQDDAGNLYGSSAGDFSIDTSASRSEVPTIFKLTPDGTLTTLHAFDYAVTISGASSTLLRESDGSLYGTAYGNGNDAAGTIFKLAPDGTFTTLHTFGGVGFNAVNSLSPLVRGGDGALYGTTLNGGTNNLGTIFKLSPDGTFTTIHNFGTVSADHPVDGVNPKGDLLLGRDGNIYGLTRASKVRPLYGAVTDGSAIFFRVTPGGTVSTAYDFNEFVGIAFNAPTSLTQGNDGNIYAASGDALCQLAPDGYLSLLYNVYVAGDKGNIGPVAQAQDGSFYGAVPDNVDDNYPFGTVFHLLPSFRPPGILSPTLVPANGAYYVSEGATATVAVHRQLGRSGAISVQYATSDIAASQISTANGTPAQAGVDYVATSGTLTWADGESTDKIITIPTIDRSIFNLYGHPVFKVTLSVPTGGATLGYFATLEVPENLDSFLLTSPSSASGEINKPFSYQIQSNAGSSGVVYDATGLPPGLSIGSFGLISGTPTATGVYAVTLSVGGGHKPLTITVTAGPPPKFTSATTASATVGSPFSYHLTTNPVATLGAVGSLPPGLSFDPATGILSGTPTQAGAVTVNFTASTASGGVASLALTLNIEVLPTVTLTLTTPSAQFGGSTYGQITLTFSSVQDHDLHIVYSVKGTGLNGTDYVFLKGTAKLKAGKTSKPIKIVPLGDGRGLGKRTVKFTLLPGDGYTVGTETPLKVKLLAPTP